MIMKPPFSRSGTPIRIALLFPDSAEVLFLRRRLERCPDLQVAGHADFVVGTEWDVVTVGATSTNLDSVRFAIGEWEALGTPELVVTLSKPCVSVMRALAHFGVEHIMTLESACAWMPNAVPALADLARARRTEKRALDALAEMPPPSPYQPLGLDPLFRAESAFRETYLHTLMACYSTAREAATAAGVPYRTLQRMLTEFGVRRKDAPPRDGKEPPAAFLPHTASSTESTSRQGGFPAAFLSRRALISRPGSVLSPPPEARQGHQQARH